MFDEFLEKPPEVSGYVKAELLDPITGKVKEKIEEKNAMMDYTYDYYKTMQKAFWLSYNNSNGSPYSLPTPRIPNTHILLTDDSMTPSPSDPSISGNLIGWASRWPIGSASGKRGNVIPSLCSLTTTSSTWVFEWAPSNGNGTFQSVSWGVAYNDNYYSDFGNTLITTGSSINNISPGATKYNAFYYSNNIGYGANMNNYSGTSYGPVLYSFDPVNGGNTTTIFSNTSINWTSSFSIKNFVKVGSDFIFLVWNGTSLGTIKFNSSGTVLYPFTALPGTTQNSGSITTDGTSVWVLITTTISSILQSNVYSINVSNGASTYGFSLPSNTSATYSALMHDGYNFIILYGTSAGQFIEKRKYSPIGTLISTDTYKMSLVTNVSESAVSPYAGTVTYALSTPNKFNIIAPWTTLGTSGAPSSLSDNGVPNPTSSYFVFNNNYIYTRRNNLIWRLDNEVVASRSMLEFPMTKTSSDTLRVTYAIKYL